MWNRLSKGEIVVVISGIALLIFSFFKWYGVTITGFGTVGNNGWGSPSAFFSILAIIIGVVMATHIIATKIGNVELGERAGPVGWGTVHLTLGVLAFVFVMVKFLSNTDFTKFGLYAGILCTLGLAIGGFMIAKERNEMPGFMAGGGGAKPPAA
jgi:hypothetical protein